MGRLIDTDDLKKAIDDWRPLWTGCQPIINMQSGAMLAVKDIMKLIDDTSTAYDVDKVVEQITDCKKGIDNAISDDEFFRNGVKAGLTMAIEIVKEGCIE